jgi:DNA primase
MSEIEDVKSRIDIVDLVGQYVTLKKAGANYKGLCPFHHERTSSFMVNPERQIFKCFGCDKGGDAFTFIQEIESIEFGDALRMLADRAGIVLQPKSSPKPGEAPSEKSRYYSINMLASQLFHKLLTDHPVGQQGRDYLKNRGITEATIAHWRIGYAPRKKVLHDWLRQKGYTDEEIQRSGKPDMFYDRIMFPIGDVIGNVVGFTGRILGQGEPKYLNTPESAIFHKSRVLFGLEQAKKSIKEKKQVIITEGQVDVISAHQAGTENVVATSGTAITQDHLRILSRYEADIVFAFDSDKAGEAATKKAIEMAIADSLSVKVIPLPAPYKDIGEIVQKNPKAWLALASKPVPAVEWQIESVFMKYRQGVIDRKLSVDEKKVVSKELIPILRRVPNIIEQAHYIQLVAKRLGVREETIQQAINQGQGTAPAATPTQAAKQRRALNNEEALLGLLELSPNARTKYQNLYTSLKSWYTEPINDLIFAAQEQYKGLSPSEILAEIALLQQRFNEQQKDRLKADYAEKISNAETSGDRESVKKLLAEFQKLIKDQNGSA